MDGNIASTYAQDRVLAASYRKGGKDSMHSQFDAAMWSHRHATAATDPDEDEYEERRSFFRDLFDP